MDEIYPFKTMNKLLTSANFTLLTTEQNDEHILNAHTSLSSTLFAYK